MGGPLCNLTGVLTGRWNYDTDTCTTCEDTAKSWLSTSQGQRPQKKTNPADTSNLDFQSPEL